MRPAEAAAVAAVVRLGRALRDAGLPVCVEDDVVLLDALAEVDVRDRTQVYWAARAVMVRHANDVPLFEALFAQFWAGLDPGRPRATQHGESDPRMPGAQQGGESVPQFRAEGRAGHLLGGQPLRASRELPGEPGDEEGRGDRGGVLAAYSPAEVLAEQRPLEYADDELRSLRRLSAELRAVVPERWSRRLRPARRGRVLDVRRTLRTALRTYGEPLRPQFAGRSRRDRRVLLVCDVSGSMARWSRVLLAGLQAAVAAGVRAEAFVFATRLTRLTAPLARRDVALALEEARAEIGDWSGGTRIGEALADFNSGPARLGLARGAVVVIVSDGWDRGDPERLAAELARLRLQARRLIWVNPRPGALGGQPLAVGMRAALPHVDDYIEGRDARAVEALARVVRAAGTARPLRRQRPVTMPA